MQVKFSQYLGKYKEGVHLPEYKFIRDICLGILKTNSVICNKIAISMNEKVSVKKVCERFTRHLNKASLGETIHNGIIEMQCRDIGLDTAIIIDDSDIVKSNVKDIFCIKTKLETYLYVHLLPTE